MLLGLVELGFKKKKKKEGFILSDGETLEDFKQEHL